MTAIITGVFPGRAEAEGAVRELHDRGFPAADVGVAIPAGTTRAAGAPPTFGPDATAWLPDHRLISTPCQPTVLTAGPIADCLGEAPSAGPGQPSLAEALTCLGITQEHARWYAQQVDQGYNIVTVRVETRGAEAQSIMDRFGSLEIPGAQRTPSHAPRVPTNRPNLP